MPEKLALSADQFAGSGSGRVTMAGRTSGVARLGSVGQMTSPGAGGWEPTAVCGRTVFKCLRPCSITTLASSRVSNTSPLRLAPVVRAILDDIVGPDVVGPLRPRAHARAVVPVLQSQGDDGGGQGGFVLDHHGAGALGRAVLAQDAPANRSDMPCSATTSSTYGRRRPELRSFPRRPPSASASPVSGRRSPGGGARSRSPETSAA